MQNFEKRRDRYNAFASFENPLVNLSFELGNTSRVIFGADLDACFIGIGFDRGLLLRRSDTPAIGDNREVFLRHHGEGGQARDENQR